MFLYFTAIEPAMDYPATPNIPGMPISPPLPLHSTNLAQNSSTDHPSDFLQNYMSPPTSVSVNMPSFPSAPLQPQVVTTPISLPGMPPITVSASVPQNSPYYAPPPPPPSAVQQTQNPGANVVVPPPTQ